MTALPDKTNGTTGLIDDLSPGQQKTNFGTLRDFIADLFGTTTAALDTVWAAFRLHAPTTLHNGSLTFAVGSSALTIALKTRAGATPSATDPVLIGQRSATAGNGDFNLRAVTAATSLVVSSGSTLGLGNSDSTPLYVYAIDNAGTEELAISQTWRGPSGICSTTAEGGAGAADSASVVYSTTARTNVPFRAIAKLVAPQTTAGTWAAVPTTCQLWPFDPPGAFSKTFTSADQTISSAGALTIAHGLGAVPFGAMYYLVCQSGELGYSTNDVVHIGADMDSTNNVGRSFASVVDATNFAIKFGSAAQPFTLVRPDTGAIAAITNASWKLRIKAWV